MRVQRKKAVRRTAFAIVPRVVGHAPFDRIYSVYSSRLKARKVLIKLNLESHHPYDDYEIRELPLDKTPENERKALETFIEKTAKKVQRWPKWKQDALQFKSNSSGLSSGAGGGCGD